MNVDETERQGYLEQLGRRISAVVRMYPTKKIAAETAGVARDQIARYEKGANVPSMETIARLAEPVGVDLNWLASGRGEMLLSQAEPSGSQTQQQISLPVASNTIEPELMGRVFDVIVRTYKVEGVSLPTIDAGRLAAEHYEQVAAAVDGPDDWPPALKMLAAQLRKAILAAGAAPASSKQRA